MGLRGVFFAANLAVTADLAVSLSREMLVRPAVLDLFGFLLIRTGGPVKPRRGPCAPGRPAARILRPALPAGSAPALAAADLASRRGSPARTQAECRACMGT